MTKNNQIKADYPDIFRDCFDFSTGDGWAELIDALCSAIDGHKKWGYIDRGTGDTTPPDIQVRQIKEKFGTLRVYVANATYEVDGMIRLAEVIASRTCEFCGSNIEVTNSSGAENVWRKNLCLKCHEERDKRLGD